MKIEVSKMTRLLTVTREGELSRVLPHQFLESLQRHDLPERYMHGLGPGFRAEDFSGFVRQTGVQPYRCECHRHVSTPNLCIYSIAESYVHVKLSAQDGIDTREHSWQNESRRLADVIPVAESGRLFTWKSVTQLLHFVGE